MVQTGYLNFKHTIFSFLPQGLGSSFHIAHQFVDYYYSVLFVCCALNIVNQDAHKIENYSYCFTPNLSYCGLVLVLSCFVRLLHMCSFITWKRKRIFYFYCLSPAHSCNSLFGYVAIQLPMYSDLLCSPCVGCIVQPDSFHNLLYIWICCIINNSNLIFVHLGCWELKGISNFKATLTNRTYCVVLIFFVSDVE